MVRKRRTHATKERARAVTRHLLLWARAAACVALSFSIALLPVGVQLGNSIEAGDCLSVCVELDGLNLGRSEAHAFIPAVAGGGALLAAELGVSEAALYGAFAALVAAGTGMYIAYDNDWFGSGQAPTDVIWPGSPGAWDDLNADQKVRWGTGSDGSVNADNYMRNALDGAMLPAEFLEVTENGSAPTPEPSDPDGKKKWQKARNVLAILAAGGTVALADALGALGENFVDSLFEPIGENVNSGFGLSYVNSYQTDLGKVKFVSVPTFTTTKYNQTGIQYTMPTGNWIYRASNISNNGVTYPYIFMGHYKSTQWVNPGNVSIGSDGKVSSVYDFSVLYYKEPYQSVTTTGSYNKNYSVVSSSVYLNANYAASYIFPGGLQFDNGIPNQDLENEIEYGQIVLTPDGITENITNYENLNNWANFYQSAPEGQIRAVQVPNPFPGPSDAPSWEDYVKPYVEAEVNPVPEDEPVDPEDLPKPDIPNPEWDFTAQLSDVVGKLNQNVFGQLFPFCLVTDMKNLSEKVISAAGYSSEPTRGGISVQAEESESPGEDYRILRIPLDDFGVSGMDEIVLDLEPILVLGNTVRPFWSVLVLVDLVAESVRIFLK